MVATMRCALIIGHSSSSPGAVNEKHGVTEFLFNDRMARLIAQMTCQVEVELVYRGLPNDYGGLPARVNATGADFAIELHANALDARASGTEMLFWYASRKAQLLARILQDHVVGVLGLPDRDIQPVKNSRARGGYLLCKTVMPCVIAEPFFIDTDSDLERAMNRLPELALAFAAAIEKYVRSLGA